MAMRINNKKTKFGYKLNNYLKNNTNDEIGESPPSPMSTSVSTSTQDTVASEDNVSTLSSVSKMPSTIPEDILCLLGEAKKDVKHLGKKIPQEISEQWGKILVAGLANKEKNILLDRMLIPENFLLAKAPKLNPKISAVIPDKARDVDKKLKKAQKQLGSGIAGLASLTTDLINSDMDKMSTIKKLSEINQILLDLHHKQTINRRKLIVPLLDKKVLSYKKGVQRNKYLFGDERKKNNGFNGNSCQEFETQVYPRQSTQMRNNPLSLNITKPAMMPGRCHAVACTNASRNSCSTRVSPYVLLHCDRTRRSWMEENGSVRT